jgi:phage-related protein
MVDIVGSAGLSIFPVMKGFKGAVSKEAKAAGKSSASSVSAGFSGKSVGSKLGKEMAAGFKSSSSGLADSGLGRLTNDVARASSALSKARLKQADTAGQVRVAETKLAEAVAKHGADSSQAVAAEERLASARRRNDAAIESVTTATGKLTTAQQNLRMVEEQAAAASAKSDLPSLGQRIKSGLSGIGSGIKTLATAGVGAAVAGITALSPAFLSTSKAAFSAYSTYEQVVGGVDTLFKSASKQLQGYAKNAYASAGVSANDYMSQVTSFSATMISSLGGDTAKAAELSNQAIIDMSDNANKMGTDLSSVQETYQSLARGNYQMLDNLKLGYGGTKTEMQRLLKDAEKITGVKYDISNFADVTQAIHAVQGELGITGTTAKEASTTIEGSVASMKASWTNWLTELGKSDADMSGLTTQLVGSIGTALKNVLPRIGVIAKSILSAIPSLFGQLTTLLPEPFQKAFDAIGRTVGSMKSVFAPLGAVLGVLGASGLGPLLTKLPVVGKLLGSVAGSGTLLGKALGVLTGPIGMVIAALVALIATTPSLRDAFGSAMQTVFASLGAAVQQLAPTFQALVTTLSGVISSLVPPLTNIITSILPPLTSLIVDLLPAITQIIGVIVQVASTIISALVPVITQLAPLITSVIQMIVPVINALIPVILQIAQVFAQVFSAVAPILGGLASLVGAVVGQIVGFISSVIVPTVQSMIPVVTSVINTIGGVIKSITTVVGGVVKVISSLLRGDWSGVWNGAKQIVSGAIDGMKSIVNGAASIGSNLVKGIWSGISNVAGWLKDKIFGFAKGVTDSIKSFFGIHSPSKLWAKEIGRFLPPGIAVGVEGAAPQLYDTVTRMGRKATDLASSAASRVQSAVSASFGSSDPQPVIAATGGAGTSVTMNISTPETDPRLQARAWAREFGKVSAGGN